MQIQTDLLQKEIKQHGKQKFPVLISHEKLSDYEGERFLWHWHTEIEITLIVNGAICYSVNDRTYHLKKGDMLFCNSMALHAGEKDTEPDCSYLSLTFDPVILYGHEESILYERYVEPVLRNPRLSSLYLDTSRKENQAFAGEILQIVSEYEKEEKGFELEVSAQLLKLWKNLILASPADTQEEDDVSGRNYERIRKVLAYIAANYRADLTLEEVAGQVHLCRSECSRMFRKYMKLSLFEYINEYRIKKSLDYLCDDSCSIGEIAELSGFSDPNYYAKVFQRYMHLSPSGYRKRKGVKKPDQERT